MVLPRTSKRTWHVFMSPVGEAQGSKARALSKGPPADTDARTGAAHATVLSTCKSPSQVRKRADDALIRKQARSNGPNRPRKASQVCANCGKGKGDGVKLQACAGCTAVLYCGQVCQRRHWPSHKQDCASRRSKLGQ